VPVSIKEINIQQAGPIRDLAFQPGRLNLIYGRNENGKTFFVEFLIRCLFRKSRSWRLRDGSERGKIVLDGLEEGRTSEFSPNSARRLEDYLLIEEGLPEDFSRLLVVKGAEVEMSSASGGIDKGVVKGLLSGKEVLDRIEERIPRTLQEAKIQNGFIVGPKRGEISARVQIEEEVKRYDRLLTQFDQTYGGGVQHVLREKIRSLEVRIQQQQDAKKYLAYSVHEELTELKSQRFRLPEDKLADLREEISTYRHKKLDLEQKRAQFAEAREKSQHFLWLKHAIDIYEQALQEKIGKPHFGIALAGAFSAVTTGLLIFLQLPVWAGAALAATVIFAVLYFVQYRRFIDRGLENRELEMIREKFAEIFGESLSGLSQLREERDRIEAAFTGASVLDKQIGEDMHQLRLVESRVSTKLSALTKEPARAEMWVEILSAMESDSRELESRIREKELYLAKLGVDESDYLAEQPGAVYSSQAYVSFRSELENTSAELRDKENALTNLKQAMCVETGDDISAGWETIIAHLREKRQSKLTEYRQKTASILGKIAVNEVLQALRADEDRKIVSRLRSPEIQAPLYQLTNRYSIIDLDGDELFVGDKFNHFRLSQLSSGAREQILLALRIGFSANLMGNRPLFLLLDDAFQYSDWERRKLLVNKAVQLAQEGWQIFYFTMDDNIKQLFERRGRKLGQDYRFLELRTDSSRYERDQISLFD
jgi:uncharacterized protein YhaN